MAHRIPRIEENPGRNGINFGSGTEISVNDIEDLIIKHALPIRI
jgi:hypothetical protein